MKSYPSLVYVAAATTLLLLSFRPKAKAPGLSTRCASKRSPLKCIYKNKSATRTLISLAQEERGHLQCHCSLLGSGVEKCAEKEPLLLLEPAGIWLSDALRLERQALNSFANGLNMFYDLFFAGIFLHDELI